MSFHHISASLYSPYTQYDASLQITQFNTVEILFDLLNEYITVNQRRIISNEMKLWLPNFWHHSLLRIPWNRALI